MTNQDKFFDPLLNQEEGEEEISKATEETKEKEEEAEGTEESEGTGSEEQSQF